METNCREKLAQEQIIFFRENQYIFYYILFIIDILHFLRLEKQNVMLSISNWTRSVLSMTFVQ